MARTMRVGPLVVGKVSEEEDGSAQVATGYEPGAGKVVVILRLGPVAASMTPEGAALLADALKAEAVYAMAERDSHRDDRTS